MSRSHTHVFKLNEGKDLRTGLLPQKGKKPHKIPNSDKLCLTEHETLIVYEAINNDQILISENFAVPSSKLINPISCSNQMMETYDPLPIDEELIVEHDNYWTVAHYTNTTEDMVTDYHVDTWLPSNKINTDSMDSWSVLSDHPVYKQHVNSSPEQLQVLPHNIPAKKHWYWDEHDQDSFKLGDDTPAEYLQANPSVTPSLLVSHVFNECTDLSTTYLGKKDISITDVFFANCEFPITKHCHAWGQIGNDTQVCILLDTGASKSYLSKDYYLAHPHLHKLPKFVSVTKGIKVGNGEVVSTLFVIPLIVAIGEHVFEVYTLVSDINGAPPLVLGVKNMVELEGDISCRLFKFKFTNRSLPFFPIENYNIPPGDKRLIKLHVPFVEELSGMAILRLRDGMKNSHLKLKLIRNKGHFYVKNVSDTDYLRLPRKKALGIVDIRSLGYYYADNCCYNTYFRATSVPSAPGLVHEHVEPQPKDKHSNSDPCLLYTSPSPRDGLLSRMPSSA